MPNLSRKTAMVAVGPSTDNEDAENATSESKKSASTDAPKTKGAIEQSDTDSASDTTDNHDQPARKSPKRRCALPIEALSNRRARL